MDVWHSIAKWLDYNRWLLAGLLAGLFASVGLVSCQVKTRSILHPPAMVTPTELEREVVVAQKDLDIALAEVRNREAMYNAEVQRINAELTEARADIARQIELRREIIELVGGLGTAVATGGFSAPAAIAAGVQLVTLLAGIGLAVDNSRKSGVIDRLKNNANATGAAAAG